MNLVANLYNPHEQSKEELIAGFVVRLNTFKKLFAEIKNSDMHYPEQHYLIEGQRGMGKTTLLLRLSYEIENDAQLNTWLIPLVLKEEVYWSVNRLFKLWEHCANLLANQDTQFQSLVEQINALGEMNNDDYERQCFHLLIDSLVQHNKKLLVFIDNIGELFQNFSLQENQRLREVLLTCAQLRIIGATAITLEAYFDYKHPFYEFFKKITLPTLDKKETHQLLQQLAKDSDAEKIIQAIIEQQTGRVESLRILTGGVIRTIVLLFEVFLDDKNGDSLHDLEQVLDKVTPLYKHRMDDLTVIQRELVDAIAVQWDAITSEEIASYTRRDLIEVLTVLDELIKLSIIHRVATSTDKNYYQLVERFFNIWYLMRVAAKRSQTKVVWLVRFLQCWYDNDSLKQRAEKHIAALQAKSFHPKAAFYFTEAMIQTKQLDKTVCYKLSSITKQYLINAGDKSLAEQLTPIEISPQESKTQLSLFAKIKNYVRNLFSVHDKDYYLRVIETGDIEAMFNLGLLYHQEQDYNLAKQYYLMAIEKGHVGAMFNLGLLYTNEQDYNLAKQYYLMAIEKDNVDAMFALGLLYANEKDYNSAKQYYLMAIEKGDVGAMNNLAWLYFQQHDNKNETLALAEQAVAKDDDSNCKHTLACIYLWHNYFEQANQQSPSFLYKKSFYEKYGNDLIIIYLNLLLAKQQYATVAQYFNQADSDYKERFKPLYYAFLKLSNSDDYSKMPPELNEPVADIIAQIKQMAIDYA